MRRMYSEQELTNTIKAVFEAELASGALDENVSDAVDAYLVEHPVDITALEGQTINPARINVANINGEANPSVKPLWYHGINMETSNHNAIITLTIFDNSNTAYNGTRLKQWMTDIVTSAGSLLIACNGNVKAYEDAGGVSRSGHVVAIFCNTTLIAEDQCTISMIDDEGGKTVFTTTLTDLFTYFSGVGDARNKIN